MDGQDAESQCRSELCGLGRMQLDEHHPYRGIAVKKKKRVPNRTATRKPMDPTASPAPRASKNQAGYRPMRLTSDPNMILTLLQRGEPDQLLTLLPPLILLDHVANSGAPGNVCLHAAHELRVVYTALGVPVEIKPVRLEVRDLERRGGTAYGVEEPHFTDADDFVGHCVLRLPSLDRLVDATVGQFPDVARRDGSPLVGRTAFALQGTDPGAAPWPKGSQIRARRQNLELRYKVLDPAYDKVVFSGPAASAQFQRAIFHNGLNTLAQMVATLSQYEDAARRARNASAPTLPALLDAVAGAEWTPSPEQPDHFIRDGADIRLRDLVDVPRTGIAL